MVSDMADFLLFDHRILFLVNNQWSSSFCDFIFPNITDLYKNPIFSILFVISIFAFFINKKQDRKIGSLYFIGLVFTLSCSDLFATYGVKNVVKRERPIQQIELQVIQRAPASGYSFPSNHATNMFAFASFIYLFSSTAGIIALLFSALIAYSRVYCGVHFPSDVIFGSFLGTLIGIIFFRLTSMVEKTYLRRLKR